MKNCQHYTNLFIGVAISKTRIKLDPQKDFEFFYTKKSNNFIESSINSDTNIWYQSSSILRDHDINNLYKGDIIVFLAEADSVD